MTIASEREITMKLTWFGGPTFRIHIGGQMIVTGAGAVPEGVDPIELVSGADRVVDTDGLPTVALGTWRPRRVGRLIEADEAEPTVGIWRADEAVLIEAAGEPPLVLAGATAPALGRWGSDAMMVLWGAGAEVIAAGRDVLEAGPVKLLALGLAEDDRDAAFAALVPLLDGSGMTALEPRLALEI
jgi:hypothetical protein